MALLAVSDEGLLATKDGLGEDAVWNIREQRPPTRIKPATFVEAVAFLPGRDLLAYREPDGAVTVAGDASGAPRARMRLLHATPDSQEWITLTPSGVYVSSEDAERSLRWRAGGKLLPGDRFHASHRRPAQVRQALRSPSLLPDQFSAGSRQAGFQSARRQALRELSALLKPPEAPGRTPTERLARALSSWNEDQTPEENYRRVTSAIRATITAGADPNTKGAYGETALGMAVGARDIDLTRELLSRKANPDAQTEFGVRPLHRAALADSPELARILLDAGAELRDGQGRALQSFSKSELDETMRRIAKGSGNSLSRQISLWLMLFLGADPNARDINGASLLSTATDPGLIRMLLGKGADPNFHPSQQRAPLLAHAASGKIEELRLLLDGGANPNARGAEGDTALMIIAGSGNPEAVSLLLARGADPNLRNSEGRTALHRAVRDHLETVRLLLEHGADPNLRSTAGDSPLSLAAAQLDRAAVRLLLQHHADPRARNHAGKPLPDLVRELDPHDRFGLADVLAPSP